MSAVQIINMPAAEYHALDHLNNGGITKLLQEGPAKYKYWLDVDRGKQTEAMLMGRAFHTRVLEPDNFNREFHTLSCPATTTEGKKEKAAYLALGVEILNIKQAQDIEDWAGGLLAHEGIRAVLGRKSNRIEQTILWTDLVDGVEIKCKARPDVIVDCGKIGFLIADLKTALTAALADLPKVIADRGYHRQAWWYMRAAAAAGLNVFGFHLLMVEKMAPHQAIVAMLANEAIEQGGRECQRAMAIYADCTKTGLWPGYPNAIDVNLPDWYMRKENYDA